MMLIVDVCRVSRTLPLFAALCITFLAHVPAAPAQTPTAALSLIHVGGAPDVSGLFRESRPGAETMFGWTSDGIFVITSSGPEPYLGLPNAYDITGAFPSATANGTSTVIVVMNDGSTWEAPLDAAPGTATYTRLGSFPALAGNGGIGVTLGNTTWMNTSVGIYVTHDHFRTLVPDTTGIGTDYAYGFAVDSAGWTYAGTLKSLYRRAPGQTTWTAVPALASNVHTLFVDRKQRLFVASYKSVKVSTDHGASFTDHSAGMSPIAFMRFGDDAAGNVFALEWYYHVVYRSTGGTADWTTIGASFDSLMLINYATRPIIRAVLGTDVLYGATLYGLQRSTDHGTTWEPFPGTLTTPSVQQVALGHGNVLFATTNNGVMRDGPWTQVYPAHRHLDLGAVMNDKQGTIYFLGQASTIDPAIPFMASTDNGATWVVDSVGKVSDLGSAIADEDGTVHVEASSSDSLHPISIFRKVLGQPSSLDIAGLQVDRASYGGFLLSDSRGFMYTDVYSASGEVLQRQPIAGGPWTMDSAGLHGVTLTQMCGEIDGSVVAGASQAGLFRQHGGPWQPMAMPPGIAANATVNALSEDSTGRLFASFVTGSMPQTGGGVWMTSDHGAHWAHIGIDTMSVTQLLSARDTTYAVTNRGIWVIVVGGSSAVADGALPYRASIISYPTPQNGSGTVVFTAPGDGAVELTLHDALGRCVARHTEPVHAGAQGISMRTATLVPGAYRCRIVFREPSGAAREVGSAHVIVAR